MKAGGTTVVQPNEAGDIELLYDLGEQNCGYYTFEMEAEAGLVVDIAGVEYIKEDGTVQHTGRYQNDMRYICKEGGEYLHLAEAPFPAACLYYLAQPNQTGDD